MGGDSRSRQTSSMWSSRWLSPSRRRHGGGCSCPKWRRRETFPSFLRPCASSRAPHHFCCTSNESLHRINKGCRALCNRGRTSRKTNRRKAVCGETKRIFNKSSPNSWALLQTGSYRSSERLSRAAPGTLKSNWGCRTLISRVNSANEINEV